MKLRKTFAMDARHWKILRDISIKRNWPQVRIFERLLEGDTRVCVDCYNHPTADKIRKAEEILEEE